MNKLNFRKNAKGFNLIELMLVLAAIVILSALVFNQYSKYQVSQKAADEAQTLTLAATGIKALYTSGNFGNLTAAVAARGGFFPERMVNGTTITNQFDGGAVDVGGVDANDGDAITSTAGDRYFGIEYEDVPADVCVKLAGAVGGFQGLSINGQTVKNTFANATTRTELDEAAVTTNCKTNPTATMLFISN